MASALQDAIDVLGRARKRLAEFDPVGYQAPFARHEAEWVDRGDAVASRQRENQRAVNIGKLSGATIKPPPGSRAKSAIARKLPPMAVEAAVVIVRQNDRHRNDQAKHMPSAETKDRCRSWWVLTVRADARQWRVPWGLVVRKTPHLAHRRRFALFRPP